ncbi:UNVERIFIED_CONTAM: hypothetical protein NCL1_00393 [Trichonephila clavipes]
MHGIDEIPLVDRTVSIARDALAGDLAIRPVAFIGAVVGIGDLALAEGFAPQKIALINRAIGITRGAAAADLALDPFAAVFKPVGQAVGALPVLSPVEELPLVDRTVIILLDQHIGCVLRRDRQGQNHRQPRRAHAHPEPLPHPRPPDPCAASSFSLAVSLLESKTNPRDAAPAARRRAAHGRRPLSPDACPTEPGCGRYCRQCRQGPRRLDRGEGRRRRHAGADRNVHHRLSDAGPYFEAGLCRCGGGSDPVAGRRLCRRSGHRHRWPRAGGQAVAQCLVGAAGRQGGGKSPETPFAEQRRFRRKAYLLARRCLRPLSHRADPHRHADLRGCLAPRCGRNAGRDRGRDLAGSQWLALSPGQARPAAEPDGGAGGRDGAATGLPQHGGRAGRSGFRRLQHGVEPRRHAGGADAAIRYLPDPCGFHARARGLECRTRPDRRNPPHLGGGLSCLCHGLAGLHGEDRLPKGVAGPVGWHRQRHRRHHRRRCAGARECALRHAALGLYVGTFTGGCGRGRAQSGLPAGYRADRRGAGSSGRSTGRSVHRHRTGHHRGKRAKPVARPDAHGAVEQVWRDVADHRQQIRSGGGLLHHLWRHEWRLQSDQGYVQDPRVRNLPLAQ